MICIVFCFVFQTQFGIAYEKKKATTQFETLSPEQSQQAEKEARATTWVQTVGGMNRGHLYGTGDMSSHFSCGGFEGFYTSQVPSASSSPSGASSSSAAHIQLIEAQQKRIEAQDMEIQTLKDKQQSMEMNMNKMMEWFQTMNAPNSRQPTDPDYVEEDEEDEEEFSPSRFVR